VTEGYRSAVAQFRELAARFPNRRLYTFVKDDGTTEVTLTCAEALVRAESVASGLLSEHGLKAGDRVLLVYPPGLEFVEAYLACLLVGVVPVPVPPPMPLRPEAGLPGYVAIATDSGAVAQLTCRAYSVTRTFGRVLLALKAGPKWPDLPWIVTDTIRNSVDEKMDRSRDPREAEVAFLQYTSGSTRAPRGVRITFGNIWAQTQLLIHDNGMDWKGAGLFWMPHYHDFALIGGIVCAMCGNYEVVLLSASAFLRRPAVWGELLTRYHATHTGAPDFGYFLLATKTTPEERAKWDFRSLRVMMTAAEPIRPQTVDLLFEALKPTGFDPEAFCPSYGLAEHTVAVALHGKKRFTLSRVSLEKIGTHVEPLPSGSSDSNAVELFGCGPPCRGVSVEIVDPNSEKVLGEGYVGEIWVDSGSKAAGYLGHEAESVAKFEARLPGSERRWLRTRDLGVLYEGELVVVGRLDDLVSIRGRNLYPQDAEGLVAIADPRIRAGRVLAFGVQAESRLYVVIELKDDQPTDGLMREVASSARILLQQELGVPESVLIFVPKGTIPKTTSGKLQRNKCRADWLAGRLETLRVDRGLFGNSPNHPERG
jgi:acyl-CoA synthetase (AMP-forming)/AMP-acid ligase II